MANRNKTNRSAKNAIKNILKMDDISDKHKGSLIDIMIWMITESNGKYSLRYESEEVYRLRKNGKKDNKGLRHEHVFQRKFLINKLLNNPKNVEEVLEKAIACVVTKEEHNQLGNVQNNKEGWDRYKKAGIKVYDKELKKWKF